MSKTKHDPDGILSEEDLKPVLKTLDKYGHEIDEIHSVLQKAEKLIYGDSGKKTSKKTSK